MGRLKQLSIELRDIDSMQKVSVYVGDSVIEEDEGIKCTSIKIKMDDEYMLFDLDDENLSLLIDALMIRSHNNAIKPI